MLTGCGTQEDSEVLNKIDNVLANVDNIGEYHTNNSLDYYDYYLPSDMSEDTLDSNSVVLKYNYSKIIMNLNISNIINERYYSDYTLVDDGFFDDTYKIYEKDGTYQNNNGTNESYLCRVYKYNDTYVLHLLTSDMNYYGTVYKYDLNFVVRQLMVMAKNTDVKYDSVISEFSNKDLITYQKTQIDLFGSTTSDTNDLSSMLVKDAVIGDQDTTSTTTTSDSTAIDSTNQNYTDTASDTSEDSTENVDDESLEDNGEDEESSSGQN